MAWFRRVNHFLETEENDEQVYIGSLMFGVRMRDSLSINIIYIGGIY